jgi:ABC-type multidrug transport system fused ATPase/permease subunit
MLAVLFAEALDALLGGQSWFGLPMVMVAAVLAVGAATLLLGESWAGESFAQSFVIDCREALFRAVVRNAGEGREARWLTGLVNDMAALRNYALRGTVRLWTSALAGSAAAGWMLLSMPVQRMALLPLALCTIALAVLLRPLSTTIASQRNQRGKLNRFLIRRVRAETTGQTSRKGHGFGNLADLSSVLGARSVRRAAIAGLMTSLALAAGLAAALIIVLRWSPAAQGSGIARSLTLTAFIAARLQESARALHARSGGQIALLRLARLLAVEPAPPTPQPRKKSTTR